AKAGHAVRNATITNVITLAIFTAAEYTPTSASFLYQATNSRSTKLIVQSASADGTSGMPKCCILRRRLRSNSSPSCSVRYATSAAYTASVPVKLPTTRPTAPQWKTATNSTIATTVISTFATLASAYC